MYEAIRRHRAAAPPSGFHWYEGAGHAFMNEERESFDAEAAAIAWERLTAFLTDRLRSV